MKTVAHLSDLHFGRHDAAIAEAMAAALRQAKPDLTVISGDLTQRGRVAQFAAARAFLDRLPAPLLVIPGNHDVPLYDVARRFLRPLARYRRFIAAELQPFFADAEIAVLGLNTARSAALANGRISYAQADAVRAAFAPVPADRLRILVTHHPLLPPPAAPGRAVVGRAALALDAIAGAGIHLVLAGHYHHAYSDDLAAAHVAAGHSLLVVQAGTAISTRRRGEPNSYNLLRIERDRLSCAVEAWQGERFTTASTRDYALIGGRWTRQ